MALKNLLKKSEKDSRELLVGLDIGTEVVKALIAEVKGDELEIIGVGRNSKRWATCTWGQSLTLRAWYKTARRH